MVGAPQPTERAVEHLLDGQQRLTALWRSFHANYEDRTYFLYFERDEEHESKLTPRVYGQARWQKNGARFPLWADMPKELHRRNIYPVNLLRPGDVSSELWAWCDAAVGKDLAASRELERKLNDLRQQVALYNIPFLSLPVETPRDVALDVFIKLNTSSVRLTPFDIIVAQVEEEADQSLPELVAKVRARAPEATSYVNLSDLVLNVAALREDRAPNQASYQHLNLRRLVDEWGAIADGIAWAVQVLEEEGIFDKDRLPTVAVLPVLAALHEHVPATLDAHGNAKALVRKYLWRSFLTRRYENAAASKALQDIRGLRAALIGDEAALPPPIFDETQFPLPTLDELKYSGWPKGRDILARGILAVVLKAGARDLADGTLASRQSLKKREYHHLFPQALLTGDGNLTTYESNRALNCALITWNTNRTISAKEPLRYLRERSEGSTFGETEIRSRLASQLIPYDALAVGRYDTIADWEARRQLIQDDYDAFLTARAELLRKPIDMLCSGKQWPDASG
jgi:hypothetical protein